MGYRLFDNKLSWLPIICTKDMVYMYVHLCPIDHPSHTPGSRTGGGGPALPLAYTRRHLPAKARPPALSRANRNGIHPEAGSTAPRRAVQGGGALTLYVARRVTAPYEILEMMVWDRVAREQDRF